MSAAENHLIHLLPRRDRLTLLACCERVELRPLEVLQEPGEVTRHAYFPTAGCISLLTRLKGHPALEVGMVGREGMLGLQLVLGVTRATLCALVQGPGSAWRVAGPALRGELARNAPLRRCLDRYLAVCLAERTNSAACQHFHLLASRLARWLLMSLDRLPGGELLMTQERIAGMLGVRRETVTACALQLQTAGLIRYARGHIIVLDRGGLESLSCDCYAVARLDYERQLPGLVS